MAYAMLGSKEGCSMSMSVALRANYSAQTTLHDLEPALDSR